MTMTRSALMAVGLMLVGAACSASFSIGGKSPEAAAAEVIETQIAEQLGWDLAADCPDLDDPQPGDSFTCTSDSPSGATIRYTVDIGDDEVNVNTVNLVNPDAVEQLEVALVDTVRERSRLPFPDAVAECADDAIVVPDDGTLTCTFSTPPGLESDLLVSDLDAETGDFTVLTPAPELIASELINTALSEQLGLELAASCPPSSTDVSDRTFECLATSPGLPELQVVAIVESGNVNVNTLNAIRADAVGIFEATAAEAISNQIGALVPAEAIDCGETTVVLDAERAMQCVILEPDGTLTALELFDIDIDTGDFSYRTL